MRTAQPLIVLCALVSFIVPATAQDEQPPNPQPKAATIEVTPEELELEVGDKAELVAVVKDEEGNVIEDAVVVWFSLARRSVGVSEAGEVEAYAPGDFELMARVPRPE